MIRGLRSIFRRCMGGRPLGHLYVPSLEHDSLGWLLQVVVSEDIGDVYYAWRYEKENEARAQHDYMSSLAYTVNRDNGHGSEVVSFVLGALLAYGLLYLVGM